MTSLRTRCGSSFFGRLPAGLRGQAEQFPVAGCRGEALALADAQGGQDAVHVGADRIRAVGLHEGVQCLEGEKSRG